MKKVFIFLLLIVQIQISAETDKYRLTLRDNPSNSIVIGWNQVSGDNPVVFYDSIDHGMVPEDYAWQAFPDREVQYAEMDNKFVRLTDLTPNTAYYFLIKDSEGMSERFWFKTAPYGPNARYSLIAGGDSRNNPVPRRNANLLVSKLKPHAILFGGDMTSSGTPEQWQEWMDDWQLTISEDGRMYPVIATRGNHEKNNGMVYNLFDVPSENIYYAITIGDDLIRAYTLNTEISIAGEQSGWLKNDLDAHGMVRWKMAQYHKPMRPHVSTKREGNAQYAEWAQLFYDKQVRLVVECDAHTVKTTWPLKPTTGAGNDEGFVRAQFGGTIYVGEGCWGAPLREDDDAKSWTRDHGMFNQFKWIFVDKDTIEVRTIKVENASEVASVPNEDPFIIPENIEIWKPRNGDVVTLSHYVDETTTGKHKNVQWEIYPNPADDYIYIKGQETGTFPVRVRILNASGKLVFEQKIDASDNKVSIRGLIPAVYIIEITAQGKSDRLKIVKQ
ncbi:MAG: T9SS type A sorting domain-containing protein [Bacteroidales bacterium]